MVKVSRCLVVLAPELGEILPEKSQAESWGKRLGQYTVLA